jgi:hypothetical protein
VLPIIAERCDVPLLWGDYKYLAGPDGADLSAVEAARRVAQTLGLGAVRAKRAWDEQGVFEALARCCTPAGVAAARQLYDSARRRGAGFAWGTGELASVSARYFVGPKPLSAFTLYEWPAGTASFSITFEYLVDAGVPAAALKRLAERLRVLPQVADLFARVGLEQSAFKKRPGISIDDVLAYPGAVTTIEAGIDELLHDIGG